MWAGQPDGFLQVYPMWAGHPDGFLQVNKFILCGLATLTGFLQVYPIWAGHPDRVPPGGGTFFLVVLYVVSVFDSGGKKVLVQFWFKYVFTT